MLPLALFYSHKAMVNGIFEMNYGNHSNHRNITVEGKFRDEQFEKRRFSKLICCFFESEISG